MADQNGLGLRKSARTVTMEIFAEFRQPGAVPIPAGGSAWLAVQPWPEYGDSGHPVWLVRLVALAGPKGAWRRYTLRWSKRLGRWTAGAEHSRMVKDLGPEAVGTVTAALQDALEGSLC